MLKMRTLTKKLEVRFGPDTGELAMRMGMHSGPVTAGVLRGDRSRFQLFGDTMNSAAKMEQHGLPDKIQVSQETADLLIAAGKEKWLQKRLDGKAQMQREETMRLLPLHFLCLVFPPSCVHQRQGGGANILARKLTFPWQRFRVAKGRVGNG
jgi:Adenylate and Guanylate cyclase catalytic domain